MDHNSLAGVAAAVINCVVLSLSTPFVANAVASTNAAAAFAAVNHTAVTCVAVFAVLFLSFVLPFRC